jgi:hypothetical protein
VIPGALVILKNLEASNVDFVGMFTEQQRLSYDIGIAGKFKSISSKSAFKDII